LKSRIASVTSLLAIVVVGVAAAVVNAQVLAPNSPARPQVDPVSTSSVSSPPAAATTTSTTLTAPSSSVPTVAEPPPAPSQVSYAVGDAGTVTLDTANNVLVVVGVVPNLGWSVLSSTSDGAAKVIVQFASPATVVELRATMLFGVVTTSTAINEIETEPITPENTQPIAIPKNTQVNQAPVTPKPTTTNTAVVVVSQVPTTVPRSPSPKTTVSDDDGHDNSVPHQGGDDDDKPDESGGSGSNSGHGGSDDDD
jgi:hypothetical protein